MNSGPLEEELGHCSRLCWPEHPLKRPNLPVLPSFPDFSFFPLKSRVAKIFLRKRENPSSDLQKPHKARCSRASAWPQFCSNLKGAGGRVLSSFPGLLVHTAVRESRIKWKPPPACRLLRIPATSQQKMDENTYLFLLPALPTVFSPLYGTHGSSLEGLKSKAGA